MPAPQRFDDLSSETDESYDGSVSRERATRLIAATDQAHQRVGVAQRNLLELIAEADAAEIWRDEGARDTAHWLGIRYGLSYWKASRWIKAAHALPDLPRLSEAFGEGEIGIDKVVELTRFATPETERDLIRWAVRVSVGAIRRKGDLALRPPAEELAEVDRARFLEWWYLDEGRRLGLAAELPADQGAIVARTIERLASTAPVMPGEADDDVFHPARRADALVRLCSGTIAADPDPDRATVIVHAQAPGTGALRGRETVIGGGQIEGGPAIAPQTLERLLCDARVQTVIENRAGDVIGLGRTAREPSAWMVRQLRYRDQECTFPGCGARRFTNAHHVRWWRDGGPTDLENLVLICAFHHRLVHEHGWSLQRGGDGSVRWFRPGGQPYRASPTPESSHDPPMLAVG
jgi:Domain of unknown function (DUF222)/HNH endonuclease